MLTQAQLKKQLYYEPNTGEFTRLHTSSRARAGDSAGVLGPDGYVIINVCSRSHTAHRLAWLYMYGVWEFTRIHHVNGNKTDNRIENLQLKKSTSTEL